jgi:hypothetical protein
LAAGTVRLATSTVGVIEFLADASTKMVTLKFTVKMVWWRSSRTLRLTNRKTKRKSRKMTMKMGRMTSLETEILLVLMVLLIETLLVMEVELQVIKALLEVILLMRTGGLSGPRKGRLHQSQTVSRGSKL